MQKELSQVTFLGIYRTTTLTNKFWAATLLWSYSCKKCNKPLLQQIEAKIFDQKRFMIMFKLLIISKRFQFWTCRAFLRFTFHMACRSGKINNFFSHKIFFDAVSSCFSRHEILFCAKSTFFCWHETLFCVTPYYFLCNVKLLVSAQNFMLFHATRTFFFWTSFRMLLCHGDIFLLSHSNKNIITCQKIKFYFHVTQKN